ncbi:hypothetical protein DPMN_022379 [Dreissena polymorpha]|uniref:Uncharacterized protein n=1 Tax=Dreissena polymorpha TaxID=45954 RepID=A0A9D4NME6_DREPO|nr:hypothetical protein DPMN_022379 [Dreissena polymorpha]
MARVRVPHMTRLILGVPLEDYHPRLPQDVTCVRRDQAAKHYENQPTPTCI